MQINIIYNQSQNSLPAGFVTAFDNVVDYFDTAFTSAVDIDLGCGATGDTGTRRSVASSRLRFHKHRPLGQQLTQIDVAQDQSRRILLVDQRVGIS